MFSTARLFALVVATFGVATTASCGLGTSEPTDGATVRVAWRYPSSGVCNVLGAPVSDDRRLFVSSDDGVVRALDLATGATAWSAAVGGDANSRIALFEDRVIVETARGIAVLDAEGGTLLWARADTADWPRGVASYLPSESLIVTGGQRRSLWGLRASNGATAWRIDVGETPIVTLAHGRRVYVGTKNFGVAPVDAFGHVLAFDVDSARVHWSFLAPKLESSSGFLSRFAMAGALVLAGAESGRLYALDAASGTEVWHFDGIGFFGGPVTDGRSVFVPSNDGHLYAVEAATGRLQWSAFFGGASLYTEPALLGDSLVLVKVGANLFAVSKATGRTAWHFSIGFANICSAPLVVGHSIAVVAEDGVYLLRVD